MTTSNVCKVPGMGNTCGVLEQLWFRSTSMAGGIFSIVERMTIMNEELKSSSSDGNRSHKDST